MELLTPWLPVIGVASSDLAANDAALHKLEGFERQDVPALFCYADEAGRFHITLSMPSNFSSLLYLLQEPGKQGGVTMGHLDNGEPLQQLQQLVEGLHLPQVQAAGAAWPEQLQQDWAAQSNGFSSALSEAVHARQGHTVLHVPREAGLHDPGAAARQRDLVQRLEVQLLRWTQQVRGLLARQRMREQRTGHNEGPMDEVAAWRLRFCHLGSLRDQLQGAGLVAVLKVLEAARSPHLAAFLSLRGSIAKEAEKAASNLRVLAALEEPCAQLAAAQPAQMAQVLPPVLHACRMVWALAPHYDTPQQLTGLLRQVSNAVVARCRSTLDVSGIFSGQGLAGAEQHLEECCCAAAAWQDLFAEAAQSVAAALPQRPWAALDTTAIFAHVDAFVQRCRDLQELCAAQRQFTSGQQLAAVLSGSKAPEIARAIAEVQEGFAQQMVRLQGLRYDVLDVACSAWYQDMAGFRSALRDLEQMLGSTLATGVTHASSLTAKLDVVEAFARLATREGLRKGVEARMSDWHQLFQAELAAVKQAFEAAKAELPVGVPRPQHAGRVLLLSGLLRRIEHTWGQLAGMAAHLPVVPGASESAAAYEALYTGLQQSVNTINMQWYANVPSDLDSHMGRNLLQQDKAATGLLHINLSPQLHLAMEESFLFEKQRLGVPAAAANLLPERQRLRVVWVGACAVTRAYNSVLGSLTLEERRLCKDRIRFMDRRVLPGVHKLTWASPHHQTAFFQKDALRCCKEVAVAVAELKAASSAVEATCALLRDALLVRVERKRLHDLADFERRQAAHQAAACARMGEAYCRLRVTLVSLYRRFASDTEEVQREWLAFLRRADAQLLEALTACVRRSLHQVVRLLQGEHKGAEVPPAFVLSVILDTNGRVELKPSLQQLFDTVQNTCKAAVAALEVLPRLLPDVLGGCAAAGPLPGCLRGTEAPPPYVEAVGQSEEAVNKQMAAITRGMSGIVERAQQLLTFHEGKYMVALWQTECTAYMRRYERANKPVSSFMADIQKYLDLREEVLSEDSASTLRWLRLDCSTLKQQLVTLCDGWVAAFVALLSNLASRQLSALSEELPRHIAELSGRSGQCMAPPEMGAALQDSASARQDEELAGQLELQQSDLNAEGVEAGLEGGTEAETEAEVEGSPMLAQAGGTTQLGSTPEQLGGQVPMTAEERQAAAERLEALHGRLEGEREELEQRIADCQEKYGALVNLQAEVSDADLERIDHLSVLWDEFVAAMDGMPARLRALWT